MTSWRTVRAQLSQKIRSEARSRREEIYTDFIKEATRLFGDALGHEREDVSDLVTLYALAARMRLIAPNEVIERAEHVLVSLVSAVVLPGSIIAFALLLVAVKLRLIARLSRVPPFLIGIGLGHSLGSKGRCSGQNKRD